MTTGIMAHNNAQPAPCQYDAGVLFRGEASGKNITGYDRPTPAVPAIDPAYQFTGWQSDLIVWWLAAPTPVYITGPAGCGKTSGLKQVAALINYPVYEITGHDALQAADLEGCLSLRAGANSTETAWLYGPLAHAMREGALFIFNEMDMASPSSLVALNTILDGAPLCIEQTGEIIRAAPGFRFAATGNSNGSGDATGAYTGVMRQNFALQDRFTCLAADYMPRSVETQLVAQAAPALPSEVHEQIMDFATLTRQAARCAAPDGYADYNDMILPMSTRAVLRWAALADTYAPAAVAGLNVLEKSLMLAFGNARDEGQRNACKEILQRITGRG